MFTETKSYRMLHDLANKFLRNYEFWKIKILDNQMFAETIMSFRKL